MKIALKRKNLRHLINNTSGLNRLAFVLAMGVAVYVFFSGISSAWSGYRLFSYFEHTPHLQNIPEDVLGKNYSLIGDLIKNFLLEAVLFSLIALISVFIFVRIGCKVGHYCLSSAIKIGKWVYKGFHPLANEKKKKSL